MTRIEKEFSSNIKFDVNGDGKIGFGDQLPDAYVLKAAADKLDASTQELIDTGKKWNPSSSDVFGALAANVPTVAPVFIDRWKTSRFILGEKATRRDFNVISNLNDLSGNISSYRSENVIKHMDEPQLRTSGLGFGAIRQ